MCAYFFWKKIHPVRSYQAVQYNNDQALCVYNFFYFFPPCALIKPCSFIRQTRVAFCCCCVAHNSSETKLASESRCLCWCICHVNIELHILCVVKLIKGRILTLAHTGTCHAFPAFQKNNFSAFFYSLGHCQFVLCVKDTLTYLLHLNCIFSTTCTYICLINS